MIEEVARIHGYEQIPEDVQVPMSASRRTRSERVLDRVRETLVASGFYEAVTTSVSPAQWNAACNPWGAQVPVLSHPPMLRGANQLRHCLAPSLLNARQRNDALSNPDAELFETASIYLGQSAEVDERRVIGLVSRRDYLALKGVVEQLVRRVLRRARACRFDAESAPDFLAAGRGARVTLEGKNLGYLGEVAPAMLKRFKLRQAASVAELDLEQLIASAQLAPQEQPLSPFPSMEQDLNFVVPESLPWDALEGAVRAGAGELLEDLRYRETYRDSKRDGPDAKRLLMSIVLRSLDATLTSERAEQVRSAIEAQVASLGGRLLR